MGLRHLISFLACISFTLMNASRLSLSVSMVNMVNNSDLELSHQETFTQMPLLAHSNSTEAPSNKSNNERLNWSAQQQGLVMGAIFLGFCLPLLISGRLSEKFGAKWVIVGGNMMAAFCAFASPFASWFNVYCMMAVTLIRGISQGFIMPAVFVLIANWSPKRERGFLSAFIVSGYYFGSVLGGIVPSILCNQSLGWPYVFYFYGLVGMVYSILFALLFYETPKKHPRISKEELKYITDDQECDMTKKRPKIPWYQMLTSVPVNVLHIALFGQLWSVAYFLSVHPLYLSSILHFSIYENGLYSSLPFIIKIAGAWSANWFSNWLFRKKYLEVDELRKLFNFAGCFGYSLGLLGAYFSKYDHVYNIVCFAISVFSVGLGTPGGMITCVDMTPNFAGTLQGLSNTFAMTTGFIVPVMVRNLTTNKTLEEWHIVFFISIAVVLGSSIIFAIFGSAEIQCWNFAHDESTRNEKCVKGHEKEKPASKVTEFNEISHIF